MRGGKLLLLGVGAFLVLAVLLMVADAGSGDWPGWDEGWALVAFPAGIPLAVWLGAAVSAEPRVDWQLIGRTTLAVWGWGAIVFVTWFLLS